MDISENLQQLQLVSISVYCPFAGYIPNGKVLLVGNMGLYDYRPYVKKVFTNTAIGLILEVTLYVYVLGCE
jgi:hypothetical protein